MSMTYNASVQAKVHVHPHYTPKIRPKINEPRSNTKSYETNPKSSVTNEKSNTIKYKEPKSVQKIQSDIKKGMNTKQNKSFSKSETDSIFKSNNVSNFYNTKYHKQSIISNPWFWVFMMHHNRINNRTNDDYLNGYKLGSKYASIDKKNKTTKNQNIKQNKKIKKSQLKNKQFVKGYNEGYSDIYLSE